MARRCSAVLCCVISTLVAALVVVSCGKPVPKPSVATWRPSDADLRQAVVEALGVFGDEFGVERAYLSVRPVVDGITVQFRRASLNDDPVGESRTIRRDRDGDWLLTEDGFRKHMRANLSLGEPLTPGLAAAYVCAQLFAQNFRPLDLVVMASKRGKGYSVAIKLEPSDYHTSALADVEAVGPTTKVSISYGL